MAESTVPGAQGSCECLTPDLMGPWLEGWRQHRFVPLCRTCSRTLSAERVALVAVEALARDVDEMAALVNETACAAPDIEAENRDLQAAIGDVTLVFVGVRAGMEYAERMGYLTPSAAAEVRAFFNGYEGAPDMQAVDKRLRALTDEGE